MSQANNAAVTTVATKTRKASVSKMNAAVSRMRTSCAELRAITQVDIDARK